MTTVIKRLFTAFLAFVIVLGFTTTVSASDSTQQKGVENAETITLSPNGHGEYAKTDEKSSNTITATATEDAEIYHIENEKYVVLTANDTYLLVDKVDIPIDTFSKEASVFKDYNVPEELIADIEKTIAEQNNLGNKDLEVAVFAPSLVKTETNAVLNPTSNLANTVQLMNDIAAFGDNEITPLWSEVLQPTYYTYNGYSLMDYMVKYWNSSTGMVERTGVSVKTIADTFIDFSVTAAGVVSKCVAFPAYGILTSALDVYQAIKGPVAYGSNSDRMYTNVIYDKILKSTQVYDYGGWNVGCISEKVWINRHDTYQFYSSTGESYLNQFSINQVYYTDKYLNPAATAVMYYSYIRWRDTPVQIQIYSTTCVF